MRVELKVGDKVIKSGMQQTLKQTLLRRIQLAKRQRKEQLKNFKDEQNKYQQGVIQAARWQRQAIKEERKARREDWLCGPLAPRRDVGEKAGLFGVAGEEIVRAPELPRRLRPKTEAMGIVPGDRVVIVRGAGRGKIGEVIEVKQDTGTVSVKGVRSADFAIPDWSPQAQNAQQKHTSADIPVPLADVRLVTTLQDDETGYTRDVVVRHMHFGPPYIERSPFSNLPRHTRYITMGTLANAKTMETAGTQSQQEGIAIPWPDEELAESKATDADTRRLTVEKKTYTPCPDILRTFPDSKVVDELRNPHSRSRATFELDEKMKHKVLFDMKQAWERERVKRGGVAIGTPKSEYWAREMERRKAERERMVQEGPDPETMNIVMEEMRSISVRA